jgi:cytochrome c553
MHNSLGGTAAMGKGLKTSTEFQGVNFLLLGSDQSSTCLTCHANASLGSHYIMTYQIPSSSAPVQRTPGGDFAWIGKSYSYTAYTGGPTVNNPGNSHGHNIIAADYGLPVIAPVAAKAPGGTYSSSNLYCTSCHDPHSSARIIANNPVVFQYPGSKVPASAVSLPISQSGSYPPSSTTGWPPPSGSAEGVYRLLGGKNYLPMSYNGGSGAAFTYDPPIAIAPSKWNQSEASAEVKVAYGSGMSEWCANCHTNIHNNNTGSSNTTLIHPAGNTALLTATANISGTTTTIASIYNAYKWSGNLTGAQATSYTSLVPYEQGGSIGSDLSSAGLGGIATNTAAMYTTPGPSTGNENVMCLSCHRAHASGFPQATRWNNENEMITQSGVYGVSNALSGGMPQLDYQAAMYDRPASDFATFQRSLCNKCHGKD